MNKPIKIKLDVTRLDKSAFFRSDKGGIYVDLVAWPVRESKFGETHIVRQDFGRDDERARTAAIAGRLTVPDAPLPTATGIERLTPPTTYSAPQPDAEEDIPF